MADAASRSQSPISGRPTLRFAEHPTEWHPKRNLQGVGHAPGVARGAHATTFAEVSVAARTALFAVPSCYAGVSSRDQENGLPVSSRHTHPAMRKPVFFRIAVL